MAHGRNFGRSDLDRPELRFRDEYLLPSRVEHQGSAFDRHRLWLPALLDHL
jgi:hypothetical protein